MPEHSRRPLPIALALVLCAAPPALATDGGSAPPDPGDGSGGESASSATYYEAALGGASAEPYASAAPGVPGALAIDPAAAEVTYEVDASTAPLQWRLSIRNFVRPHERVDGIYDMILVLPTPVAGFRSHQRGVKVTTPGGAPLAYGGEEIVLKRNHGLEKTLLAALAAADASNGGLPDLSGTGYRFTAWDTIVHRDPDHGGTVEGQAELTYETDAGVAAPDPADPRFAAYLITWIPSLPASIPPYAVRMDVVETP